MKEKTLFDLWFMNYDLWFMIYDLWFNLRDVYIVYMVCLLYDFYIWFLNVDTGVA